MSSKSDGSADEHAEYWSPIEGSIAAVLSRADPPRSITPKGTLFPNLGEAHQAITSRLVSRSAVNHIPDTFPQPSSSTSFVNVSSSAGSPASPQSAHRMELVEPSLPARQRCLTPFSVSASTGAEWAKTPTEPSPVVSGFESSSASNSVGEHLNNGVRADSAVLEPSEAENSMEDIYDQYYAPMTKPSSSAEPRRSSAVGDASLHGTHLHHSEMNLPSVSQPHNIQRASTSIDAGETIDAIEDRWHMYHPASEIPQRSLPEPPRAPGHTSLSAQGSINGVQNFSRPVLSVHSVSNLQEPTAVSTHTSQASALEATSTSLAASNRSNIIQSTTNDSNSDFVIYGRLPPQPYYENLKDRTGQEPGVCQEADVSHGPSTDSDEDPFMYDRGSFTVFLQPSREREVSAALRCVSADSTASASGIFQHVPSQEPDTPRAFQSTNPFVNRLETYQANTINYDWDDGETPKEVKISVRSPPPPPNSPVQQAIGLSEFVQGLGSGRRRKDINTLMSDGADWETVADSVGQFDSNRALASSMGLTGSYPLHVTGSSIADYSDTSSIHVPQFDAFSSSTERILQHPASEHMHNARYPRSLNDTRRPVFLPKPRIHRVNGYLQNSSRMFTDTTTGSSANSARSALV